MKLSPSEIDAYARDGVVFPVAALSPETARHTRALVESAEARFAQGVAGRALSQYFRVNGQIVLPFLAEIARQPQILDAVESILGPDLLVWSVELFIKEPDTPSIVSWHQDITYWGMGETDEELTAWIALSDVTEQAGCMRFIPGSHKNPIVPHMDTDDPDNLLSRGQEIAGIDEARAVAGPIKPGQMSFHHGRTFHASGPNRSNDRRIGLAIRYVTPAVRQSDLGRDYAMLVRGRDLAQGWINMAPPAREFEPSALALYEEVLAHQAKVLAAGASNDVALYAVKGT